MRGAKIFFGPQFQVVTVKPLGDIIAGPPGAALENIERALTITCDMPIAKWHAIRKEIIALRRQVPAVIHSDTRFQIAIGGTGNISRLSIVANNALVLYALGAQFRKIMSGISVSNERTVHWENYFFKDEGLAHLKRLGNKHEVYIERDLKHQC